MPSYDAVRSDWNFDEPDVAMAANRRRTDVRNTVYPVVETRARSAASTARPLVAKAAAKPIITRVRSRTFENHVEGDDLGARFGERL